jgi:lipopolysaccharide/colanic/teichoic acid biosynthesis glycosyltransferase
LFKGVRFASLQDFYEEVFERVPLEFVNEQWFLEHVSTHPQPLYAWAKRLMDVVIALPLALISLIVYPVIWLLIRLEDGGPLFFNETRIGQGGSEIKLFKFRSMSCEPELEARQITRVGHFLRKTRLDELPQLWSVVRGDQSLIGPRPERPDYVKMYREEVPYYDIRHLTPPGLSGWAQMYQKMHPHFRPSADATREKLSYDLYYLKHRSLWLDIKIALKTIKTVLSHQGI